MLPQGIALTQDFADGYLLLSKFPDIYPNQKKDSRKGIEAAGYEAIKRGMTLLDDIELLYTSGRCHWFDQINRKDGNGWEKNPWTSKGLAFVGSVNLPGGKQPEIRLMDGAKHFQNPNKPAPILQISHYQVLKYNKGKYQKGNPPRAGAPITDPFGAPADRRKNSSLVFNCEFRNIKITTGNNPGAYGLAFPAAQGSQVTNVTIDARGGFGGFAGLPGRNNGGVGLKVIGGRHALVTGPAVGIGAAGEVLVYCEFTGQTHEAIVYEGLCPLNLVGCRISKKKGAIANTQSRSGTAFHTLSFTDCVFEVEEDDGSPLFGNNESKTLHFLNCWARGAKTIVRTKGQDPLTTPKPDEWSHIALYNHTDPSTSGKEVFKTHALVSNLDVMYAKEGRQLIAIRWGIKGPPPSLRERHKPKFGVLQFEDGGKLDAIRFTDAGGDPSNSPEANSKAMEKAFEMARKAGHNRVFVPLFGKDRKKAKPYDFARTIEVPKDMKIFGATFVYGAALRSAPNWKPKQLEPLIRTANDADCETYIGTISLLLANNQFDVPMGFVHYRSGKGCMYMVRSRQDYEFRPKNTTVPYISFLFTDNAGGQYFGYGNDGHIDWAGEVSGKQGSGNRSILIDGVSAGLACYHINLEGGKKDITRYVDLQIRDSKNVAVFGGIKREAKTGIVSIENCENIYISSFGAMRELPKKGLIFIKDSKKILLGPALVQATIHGTGNLLLEVKKNGKVVEKIPYPQGFSIYQDGDIDLDKMFSGSVPIPVMEPVEPVEDDSPPEPQDDRQAGAVAVATKTITLTREQVEKMERYGLADDGGIAPKRKGAFLRRRDLLDLFD